MRRLLATIGAILVFSSPVSAEYLHNNWVAPTPPAADNSNRIATTAMVQAAIAAGGGGGGSPLPSQQIFIGSIAGVAAAQAVSGAGDCSVSLSNSGVFTFICTKTNGSSFAQSATTDTTNAANITSGTLSNARLSGVGLTANPLSQFASTTSAQLAGVLSDETGTGSAVFANGPTFTGTVNMAALVLSGNLMTNITGATQCLQADGFGVVTGTGTACGAGGGGSPGGLSGQIQFNNSGAFGGFTAGGDATINTSTGAVTVTKTNGTSFASSATTDTTNASNISSGTLASALLPSPFTGGTASGTTTQFATTFGTLTSGNCAKWDASGNIIDAGTTCGGGGGSPGGSNGDIQYNNAGSFAGISPTTAGYSLMSTGPGASSFQGFLQGGTGGVTRTWQDKASDWLNAKDFGVKCDGSTNDVSAINAAITAANSAGGGTVMLPKGTCIIGGSSVTMASNVYLRGAGVGVTILKLASSFAGNAIIASSKSFIGVSDFTVDVNGNITGSNGAVNFTSSSDWYMRRLEVKNMTTFGLVYNGATRFQISESKINRSATATTQNQAILGSNSSGNNTGGRILNNIMTNSGVDLSDIGTVFANNTVSGFGFGAGLTTEQSAGCYGLYIAFNNITGGGTTIDANGYMPGGLEQWCPDTTIVGNYISNNGGAGMDMGGTRNRVIGNVVKDNSQSTAGSYHGIVCRYGTSTYNCNGSILSDNQSYNTNGASGNQGYGYSEESASISGVKLVPGNNFSTNKTGDTNILSTSTEGVWIPFTPTFAATGGTSVVYTNSNSAYYIQGKTLSYKLAWSMTWSAAPTSTSWTFPVSKTSSGNNLYIFHCVNTGIQANGFSSNAGTNVSFGPGVNATNLFSASGNTYIATGYMQIQ